MHLGHALNEDLQYLLLCPCKLRHGDIAFKQFAM